MTPQGQVVLVLQGGGALGAYQGGVYEALHEAGLEPDWVIGGSSGCASSGGAWCRTRRSPRSMGRSSGPAWATRSRTSRR